jgi:hypothetical protein
MPPKKSKGAKKRSKKSRNLDSSNVTSSCSEFTEDEVEILCKPTRGIPAIPEQTEDASMSLCSDVPRTSLLSQHANTLLAPQNREITAPKTTVKATLATEQDLSATIGRIDTVYTKPLSKTPVSASIPKSIPRRHSQSIVATPSSIFQQSYKNNLLDTDSEMESIHSQTADILAEHLVQPHEICNSINTAQFGSLSHSLQGGYHKILFRCNYQGYLQVARGQTTSCDYE